MTGVKDARGKACSCSARLRGVAKEMTDYIGKLKIDTSLGTYEWVLAVLTSAGCIMDVASAVVGTIHVVVGAHDLSGDIHAVPRSHFQSLIQPQRVVPQGVLTSNPVEWALNVAVLELTQPVPSNIVSTFPVWQGEYQLNHNAQL